MNFLDVRKHANPNTSIMVLGNKSDLESKRQVTREEAERFAKENDLFYLETSAKAANNVEEAFVKTTEDIYNKIKAGVFDVSNQVSFECCIRNGIPRSERELTTSSSSV
jgi:Ras-related protein Rab-2A